MGSYVPNTEKERQEMLQAAGYSDMKELFADIPEEVRLKGELEIPEDMPELSVRREMEKIAGKNQIFQTIFRGAGAYRHYIPAAVKSITSKENFVTAYTPYQAEISQGILQSIFEYQTMICDLTGMDASNASVYDGASAAAEGIAMCRDPETPESSDFTDRFPVRDPDSADLLPWKRDAGGADSGTGRSDGQRSFKRSDRCGNSMRLHPASKLLRKSGGCRGDRKDCS